jgi:hypothetical protein
LKVVEIFRDFFVGQPGHARWKWWRSAALSRIRPGVQ